MSDVVQLLCLPHSGATAQAYLRWTKFLPRSVVVQPVEPPGRGARAGEPLRSDLVGLASDLADELMSKVGARYALFGHSIGAVLAFEIAHALIERGAAAPMRLFVSASAAPALRDDRAKAKPLTDDELIDELRRLRGTPEGALLDPELMALVLPVLRADFLMAGGYRYRRRDPLPCPVAALGGASDEVPADAVEAWSSETASGFAMKLFEGGHFFIHEREREALDFILDGLAVGTAGRAAA